MKSLIRAAWAGVLAATIAGCLATGPGESRRHYLLEDSGARAATGARPARAATLLVAPATAAGFYETRDIAYSRAPGTRAYYQFHGWTERPGRRIGELLLARLERSGSFTAVADVTSGIRGTLVLNVRLTEFYHDAAIAPGNARVAVTAELTDIARRVLVARRVFEQTAPAATHDAPGAVQAFNKATAAMLDDIATWVDDVAPR